MYQSSTIGTVGFNSDGGAAVASLSGPDGSSITLPTDTYPGYTFDGWFTAASDGTEVGGTGSSYTIPSGGITLYAQWTAIPIPKVSAVSPNSGPTSGGTSITITGTGFEWRHRADRSGRRRWDRGHCRHQGHRCISDQDHGRHGAAGPRPAPAACSSPPPGEPVWVASLATSPIPMRCLAAESAQSQATEKAFVRCSRPAGSIAGGQPVWRTGQRDVRWP